ncbi:MAG: cysteine--tRNA ligase [Candidatus Methanomethylophilaceae archaeon]|nr:cysteine--tRNA ligase [Candidatus Methanomethylophilaceae archaeon]
MTLFIHNTLTGKKEEFKPIEEGKVKMYVCGVTVYDDIHMGHARSMIVFDTVAKYLRYSGYDVMHVTNFTDVDDKIMDRAAKVGIEPLQLSSNYIDKYFEDTAKLGIGRANLYPKASESIDDIIEMVKTIIDNGFGYVTSDGSVYFSVDKVEDYGRLTNQKLENMGNQGRQVMNDEEKKNPMDFAVWKAAKPGEISWDSPWGKGRPGWHIECSAMIKAHMGDTIDIHGGGNDLIFPHHENEILQTEACTGKPLSNYWMHNGMLTVKGVGNSKEDKMSKSLGNFFRVEDVAAKYDSQTIRFYFLNTHYMSPLLYGEEYITKAADSLKRLWNNYREIEAYLRDAPGQNDASDLIEETRAAVVRAMDDDFNTADGTSTIFELVSDVFAWIKDGVSKASAEAALALLNELCGLMGYVKETNNDDELVKYIEEQIALRVEAKKAKNFAEADRIRNELAEKGIILKDTREGTTYTINA